VARRSWDQWVSGICGDCSRRYSRRATRRRLRPRPAPSGGTISAPFELSRQVALSRRMCCFRRAMESDHAGAPTRVRRGSLVFRRYRSCHRSPARIHGQAPVTNCTSYQIACSNPTHAPSSLQNIRPSAQAFARPSNLNPLTIKSGPTYFQPGPFRWRETGALGMYGWGGPTRHVCSIRGVVHTRDRVAGAALLAALAQFSLRSFPKIASALSAKVCGGSRSAKRPPLPFDKQSAAAMN
jgi:hypothetical protein